MSKLTVIWVTLCAGISILLLGFSVFPADAQQNQYIPTYTPTKPGRNETTV